MSCAQAKLLLYAVKHIYVSINGCLFLFFFCLLFDFFFQIKKQHPHPASLTFYFKLPTASLFLQNASILFPCKWMSDIGRVCSTCLTSCRFLALPRWPLRGGTTFRPRSLSPRAEWAKKTIEIANPAQVPVNVASCFASSSDTDKHTCYRLSSCLALTLSFEMFEALPCRRSLGSSPSFTGALNPASFLRMPAFRYICDDFCH